MAAHCQKNAEHRVHKGEDEKDDVEHDARNGHASVRGLQPVDAKDKPDNGDRESHDREKPSEHPHDAEDKRGDGLAFPAFFLGFLLADNLDFRGFVAEVLFHAVSFPWFPDCKPGRQQ